jgi:uncharacterized MnhB-related membrane protein
VIVDGLSSIAGTFLLGSVFFFSVLSVLLVLVLFPLSSPVVATVAVEVGGVLEFEIFSNEQSLRSDVDSLLLSPAVTTESTSSSVLLKSIRR